ncbi:MAG: pyridoxamine 5'-phosphate oxidase [Gammaproteobacteria bacterium]|nr:pyridoxamine 5'-phosphate oxidase [Gammaproteobacteria bacterium]NVK87117.1 pyridoxamine 5'-phosphate oxidase [Gammaproteobacteria bacterium]
MQLHDAQNQSPFALFEDWLAAAKEHDPEFYNGMTIATVTPEQTPDSRVVLLKEYDSNGFVFYTNYLSRKGKELSVNPHVCANFWWSHFQRQVRIEGHVEKVSTEQSDRYFLSRPRGSQLAAIASQQSKPIETLDALHAQYDKTVKEHQDKPITRPAHWGGFRIKPTRIEFWQGLEHRLHHRLVFRKKQDRWISEFLQP